LNYSSVFVFGIKQHPWFSETSELFAGKLKMTYQKSEIFSNISVFLKQTARGKLSKMHKICERTQVKGLFPGLLFYPSILF
jgi:hypothetical protein